MNKASTKIILFTVSILFIIAFITLDFFQLNINQKIGQGHIINNNENVNNENIKKQPNVDNNNSHSTNPKDNQQPNNPKQPDVNDGTNKDPKDNEENTKQDLKNEYLILVNKENHLSANYNPSDLIQPQIPFNFSGESPKKLLRKKAADALEKLFSKAEEEGISLVGQSGYRSYETQEAIFAYNEQRYGHDKANQVSAIPGQSEHQTGLSIDVTDPNLRGDPLTIEFGDTESGKWLADNAYKFGFIIRYPKGKEGITGYQYEPWHIRYVGIEAATKIKEKNITLEEFLELQNLN